MANEKNKAGNIIKHFLKDPVKTTAEASARIKETIPYLSISFGAVCVFLILGMLIEPIKAVFNVLGFVCMAGVFLFGLCLFRAIQAKKRLANLECSNCKTVIKYDDNVTYKINTQSFNIQEFKNNNQKAGVDVYIIGRELIGVTISCKCQECGTVKEFSHIFKTIEVESEKHTGISSLNADLLLRDMKDLMRQHYETRFANAAADYKIKINKTIDKAIKDYFCDDGTVYKN